MTSKTVTGSKTTKRTGNPGEYVEEYYEESVDGGNAAGAKGKSGMSMTVSGSKTTKRTGNGGQYVEEYYEESVEGG